MHTGVIVSSESDGSSVRISADFLISLRFAEWWSWAPALSARSAGPAKKLFQPENDRLDIMHHILTTRLNGAHHLAPIGNKPQKILDIGCGTGKWHQQYQFRYPEFYAELTRTLFSVLLRMFYWLRSVTCRYLGHRDGYVTIVGGIPSCNHCITNVHCWYTGDIYPSAMVWFHILADLSSEEMNRCIYLGYR